MKDTLINHKWKESNVNSKEYINVLLNDPRPWWNELPPPKKRTSKSKLTSISRLKKHGSPSQS